MKQILQHILFPDDDSLVDYRDLFYRGARGILTDESEKTVLCLAKYENLEFSTYFNGVSYAKWQKYTDIKQVSLYLRFEGDVEITLCGYSLANDIPVRTVFEKHRLTSDGDKAVCLTFPETSEKMLAFEISTFSEVKLYDGYYEADFEREEANPVELALSTTTCWKEQYIINNVQRLKDGILDLDDEISSHFRIHIVDNGRTLKREDFPDDERIYYHSNKNTGGSGGFARGMIECRHQDPVATHVLLMDDDVLILPDSIYRTYVMLKTVKEEYKNSFIGGAMLILEEKNIQHEDTGVATGVVGMHPLKPRWNHFSLKDNLLNERTYYSKNMYQAWWYCCIPMTVIDKFGLPLPLFIRCDDMEYSLRCGADIISMNGICVWHMGFFGKYSASMNLYQECRNWLIDQSVSGILPGQDLMDKIKKLYRSNLLRHDYDASELVLRAVSDYMKGPRFIMEDRGEAIIKENGKKNVKLVPFDQLKDYDIDLSENPYWDCPRTFFKKWLFRITYNGHRFWPESRLGKKPVSIGFDGAYEPGKMAMNKTYIFVNPVQQTGCVKEIDKNRFKELQNRYHKVMKDYKKNGEKVRKEYADAHSVLVSEKFWRKYLEI